MNIKTNKKYLLLIPLAVTLIMLTFFSSAYNEIIRQKHDQMYNTVQNSINFSVAVIDRLVETNKDWNVYDYSAILMPVISQIDEESAVHVALLDEELIPLSGNFVYDLGVSFDLSHCEEFVNAVRESGDKGELIITITEGVDKPYEMHVYFQKIPTGEYDKKFIAVFGVSRDAIEDNFAPWLVWGMIGMVVMTVILQVWMVLYISKLADAERLARRR